MKKNLLLTAVITALFTGNIAFAVDVSDWNGLKSNDGTLTLINNINDPSTSATGNPIIKQNITQIISGGENKYSIDGTNGGIDGFINAQSGANLTFENLTIQNFSKAKFIGANDNASLNIINSVFKDNTYSANGNAVSFNSTGKFDLLNVRFENNSNTSGGGAAYFTKGTLSMTDVNFTNNSANSAGAFYMHDGNAVLKNVTFENNTARNSGGAMSVGIGSVLEMDNVTFNNNTSTNSYAGALEIAGTFSSNAGKANNVTIKNSHFEGNAAQKDDGGAIHMGDYSTLTVDNTKFYDNVGTYSGGAIMTGMNGALTIKNSEFKGNHTRYDSGAVGVNGALDVYNTTFDTNYSAQYGGAIWTAQHSAHSNIISSTFKGNYSKIGGAIWFEDKNVKVIDSAFEGNHANYGGAIYFQGGYHDDPAFNIIDTSFTANNYANEGGAIYLSARDLNIFADKKDVTFSGNIANNDDFTDLANSYNGGGAIYFDASNTLSLNASAGRKMIFDDTIASYGDNTIDINNSGLSYINQDGTDVTMGNTGEIQFNNFVGDGQGNIFNINLYGGTVSIGQNDTNNAAFVNPDGYINFNNFNIKGDSILNTVNDVIGEFAPKTFLIDNDVNWQYKFDVNLAGAESDKLAGAENNGTLTISLADLNIMSDAENEKIEIQYSDTNVNGIITGNKLTTSNGTYDVNVKNDTTGSFLIFQKAEEEQIGGLPGAIKNQADVYTITNGQDENVERWITNVVTKDLIVNTKGHGITTDNNLDGIIISENNSLTLNDAKYFSGFNNAFTVSENAELILNNSNLTGNIGDAVITNKGTVNINALLSDVLIEQGKASSAISSNGGVINLNGEKTITIDGSIIGSNNAKMNINSDTTITGTIDNMLSSQNSGNTSIGKAVGGSYTLNNGNLNIIDTLATDTFAITGGTLDLTNGIYASQSTILSGGNINMLNGSMNNLALGNVTLSGTTNLSVDANLTLETMDRISASALTYNGGLINVNNINFIGNTNKSSVIMPFADDVLKAYVTTDIKSLMGEIFKYSVGYDKETGNFTLFSVGSNYKDFNPSIIASPVAAQLGGYLTQLNSYDEAFRNMDMYMLMTKKQRQAMKLRNKYAAADGMTTFDPNQTPYSNSAGWFRPYTTFENVPLKNGPKVSNVAYGSFFGAESEMYDLGNGWDGMWGAYVGYNGSHQAYNGIGIYQNGGTLGAVGMAYKGNFFTGLTVNAGANAGEASTMYGNDNFSMLMTGIASKSGYNFELADGKFIIQPNFLMSYSFVNTFDYTNASGVKINSDPLHAIQIEPGLKFIGNLKNGWQPYAGVSMVWNIMDKTHFKANDVSLPELSVKPFVKYGVGVRKTWGERLTGFFQCYLTNGGRNGVGLQTGFRFALGKTSNSTSGQNTISQLKKTEIKTSTKR